MDEYNVPCLLTDAKNIFYKKSSANDTPYVSEMIKVNNNLINEWHDEMLLKMAGKNNHIASGAVVKSLTLFLEGKNVKKSTKALFYLPSIEEENIDWWKTFFEQSVSEICQYNIQVVLAGWSIITNYVRIEALKKRYEFIYQNSDDPMKWWENAVKYHNIMEGNYEILTWSLEKYKEISDKVNTILGNLPKPN